jgi:hypothetical protein
MIDPDLKNLADLWQEPNAADNAAFEAMARKARRQARLMAYGDAAWLVLIVVTVGMGAFLKPNLISAVVALTMLATTLWINWMRRRLRQITKTIDTADRAGFLESCIRITKGSIRRVTLTFITFPPAMLLAILFRVSTKNGGDILHPWGAIAAWATSLRGIVALTLLGAIALWNVRARIRLSRELRRLHDMKQDYLEEDRKDEAEGG